MDLQYVCLPTSVNPKEMCSILLAQHSVDCSCSHESRRSSASLGGLRGGTFTAVDRGATVIKSAGLAVVTVVIFGIVAFRRLACVLFVRLLTCVRVAACHVVVVGWVIAIVVTSVVVVVLVARTPVIVFVTVIPPLAIVTITIVIVTPVSRATFVIVAVTVIVSIIVAIIVASSTAVVAIPIIMVPVTNN